MPIVQHHKTIATINGYGDFETVSGGALNQTMVDHYEAGSNSPTKLPGTYSLSDMSLTRAYDPIRDKILINAHRAVADSGVGLPCVVVKKYLGPFGAIQDVESYRGYFMSAIPPDGQAGDASPGMITVNVAIEAKLT